MAATSVIKKELEMERIEEAREDENNMEKNSSGEVEKSNIVGVVLSQSLDEGSGGKDDSGVEEREHDVSEEPIVISSEEEEEEEEGDIYLCSYPPLGFLTR